MSIQSFPRRMPYHDCDFRIAIAYLWFPEQTRDIEGGKCSPLKYTLWPFGHKSWCLPVNMNYRNQLCFPQFLSEFAVLCYELMEYGTVSKLVPHCMKDACSSVLLLSMWYIGPDDSASNNSLPRQKVTNPRWAAAWFAFFLL